MKRRLLTTIALLILCVTTFLLALNRHSQWATAQDARLDSTACAVQPDNSSDRARQQAMLTRRKRLLSVDTVSLTRFRQAALVPTKEATTFNADKASPNDVPREEIALVDPTNYGDRYLNDANGKPASFEPLVVLHETVGSASSAINLFQTFHLNDDDQVSYHTLVKRNGTIVYLVPPDKRAFGAGNSAFMSSNGAEAVKTNAALPGSVNNFAYHISLETPYDGNNNGSRHSGYTQAQYQSLAWLVAKTGVVDERITTHKAVDRSRSRIDPRSFNDSTFFSLLQTQPRTTEIAIRCTDPSSSFTQPQQGENPF